MLPEPPAPASGYPARRAHSIDSYGLARRNLYCTLLFALMCTDEMISFCNIKENNADPFIHPYDLAPGLCNSTLFCNILLIRNNH